MSAFRRAGAKAFIVKVPKPIRGWVNRGAGTSDRQSARAMQLAVDTLAQMVPRPDDVLAKIVDRSLTMPAFLTLWAEANGQLEILRARLASTAPMVDLAPLVAEWHTGLRAHVTQDTRDHYAAAVRSLILEDIPFPREQLTLVRLQAWLDAKDDAPSTVRKHGSAMRLFVSWLKRRGTITEDVARDLVLPPAGKPRVLFLETPEAIRLADKQPSPYRELSALLAGTGIEVSVALQLRRRDVDATNHEIRAIGTKTHTRDRIVRVADWAWPYAERLIGSKLPDTLLFPGIPNRWEAGDGHRAAIAALTAKRGGVAFIGYTMRDARHTWAVRAVRAGVPIEVVARQLGHVDGVLALRVYGRFAPKQEERAHWEKIATARDEERAAAAKTIRRVK